MLQFYYNKSKLMLHSGYQNHSDDAGTIWVIKVLFQFYTLTNNVRKCENCVN